MIGHYCRGEGSKHLVPFAVKRIAPIGKPPFASPGQPFRFGRHYLSTIVVRAGQHWVRQRPGQSMKYGLGEQASTGELKLIR
jgi:hypothetical protein